MIDAMKSALETLEHVHRFDQKGLYGLDDEIDLLRQAIEQAEKEATLQEITDIGQWDTSDMAHRAGGLSVDMSTKPENIDTSAERVHDIDILRQSEREGWRYAKECETEIERLKVIIYEFENDDLPKPQNELDAIDRAYFAGKEAGIAEVIKPWQRLTDEEIVACGWCDLRFARAIEAKLKEKNT